MTKADAQPRVVRDLVEVLKEDPTGSVQFYGLEFVTITAVAKAAGVSRAFVARAVREGRVGGAVRVRAMWLIDRECAERWLTTPRKSGRPPRKPKQLALDLDP